MTNPVSRPKLVIDFSTPKPLGEVVYEALKNAITENQFKAGDRLMETDLADEMQVSRTPVREAVRKLEAEGYVTIIPRKGTYVAGLTVQDINDVFEIRYALEGMAAYFAAQRATQEDIEELRAFVERQAANWNSNSVATNVAEDIEFHSMLYRMSKNQRVEGLITDLRLRSQRLRNSTLSDAERLKYALEEHKEILQAIETRDSVKAREMARNHVVESRNAMLRLMQAKES